MAKTEFVVFSSTADETRLDMYLAGKLTSLTRSRIKKLITEGKVKVNGASRKAGCRLRENDVIEVDDSDAEEKSSSLKGEDIPLAVLYADSDILVINKPFGLIVHPGAGHKDGTLVNGLIRRFPEISSLGPRERPGIVHRLDKETSGVMVVARSPEAYASLQRQFKERAVNKIYIGLAWGKFPAPEGRLDWPIGRHIRYGQKISVRSRRPRPAETFYRVLKEFKETSLLEIRPVTGRTHQIRVHLATAGHPLAGDARYGRRQEKPGFPPRLFLHAHKISFFHPGTATRVEFTSELPSDLEQILSGL